MVVLSLADVGGFMYFWGLTVDTVSCINLIIAMGLCVDYSAHVAHRYQSGVSCVGTDQIWFDCFSNKLDINVKPTAQFR
jgi:Niemann-Pick C1 protein